MLLRSTQQNLANLIVRIIESVQAEGKSKTVNSMILNGIISINL